MLYLSVLAPEQLQELLNSIYVRGEIPLKFAYLNEGARNWTRLSDERMRIEHFSKGEIFGVKAALSHVFYERDVDSVYLVDLGCGTGDSGEGSCEVFE